MNKITPIDAHKPQLSILQKCKAAGREISSRTPWIVKAALKSFGASVLIAAGAIGCIFALAVGDDLITGRYDRDTKSMKKALQTKIAEIDNKGCTLDAADGQKIKYTFYKYNLFPRDVSGELHVGVQKNSIGSLDDEFRITVIPLNEGRSHSFNLFWPTPSKQKVLSCGLGSQ